jgi:hypothetical protein
MAEPGFFTGFLLRTPTRLIKLSNHLDALVTKPGEKSGPGAA